MSRFTRVGIADDGLPVRIACVDPRVFALYRRWMADDAPGREPAKQRRDRQQARAAAEVAQERLGLKLVANELSALPLRLVQHAKDLARG